MKKQMSLVLITAMLLASAGCGSSGSAQPAASTAAPAAAAETNAAAPAADAQADQKDVPEGATKLIFATGVTDTHPQAITLEKFADEFEKETDGRYVIECYHNNTLGDDETLAEMCRTNTIQGWSGSLFGALPNYIPEFGTFALPYILRSYDEAYEYLHNSEMMQGLMEKLENDYNIHYVDTTLNGVRALTTKDTKVLSPADLKGKKIRSMTAQVWQDVISALGGTPVPIAYSELYMSMQTGVVDGQDNGISNVYSSKFYEVQGYFMKTDHGLTLSDFCLNADIWKNMSPEDQETFNRLWTEICVKEDTELMEKYYEEGFEAVKKAGMVVVEQDEMDMQAFYDSAEKMIDEKYVNDPVFGPVVQDIREYFGR